MEGVADVFNEDFAVKNIARAVIRTHDLRTLFFIIADAPSIKAYAWSWSRIIGPFQVASSLGGLAAAAIATVLVAGKQSLYTVHPERVGMRGFAYNPTLPGPPVCNSVLVKITHV